MKKCNRWKKASCAALCAGCLTLAAAVPAAAGTAFADVDAGAWYAPAVEKTVSAGLLSGTGKTTFSPGWAVTRAMAVTVLWRLAGSPAAGQCTFTDVAEGTWYTQAVAWAEEKGIASGNGKGLFQPESYVTREQLAVFLYKYAQVQELDTAQGKIDLYSDAKEISAWARDGMEHALGAGILQGSGSKLMPQKTATRAELAVMLVRLITPAVG